MRDKIVIGISIILVIITFLLIWVGANGRYSMIVKQVFMIIAAITFMVSLALMMWGLVGGIYFCIYINKAQLIISLGRMFIGLGGIMLGSVISTIFL